MLLALTGGLCGAKPRLIQTETPVSRNNLQYRKISKHFFFHQTEMTYHYLLDPENNLVKQKWGDFELGLRHGRIQNGSWCMWNFFSCYMPGKKSLTDQSPADSVSFTPLANGLIAEIVWPELTLKMIQLENAKEWIFMEVKVKETPDFLRLRVWPGGAKWKPADGGVRKLMAGNEDISLPMERIAYPKENGAIALYNRNYSERNGNFLVFEPEKYSQTLASANNMVILDFIPKAGEKVFHFALSYFLDEDPLESCDRFLKERSPNIATMLKQIQWVPQADFSAYFNHVAVIEKILAQSGLTSGEKAAFQQELTRSKERFQKAETARNIPDACQEIEFAEQLRTRIGQAALKTLH